MPTKIASTAAAKATCHASALNPKKNVVAEGQELVTTVAKKDTCHAIVPNQRSHAKAEVVVLATSATRKATCLANAQLAAVVAPANATTAMEKAICPRTAPKSANLEPEVVAEVLASSAKRRVISRANVLKMVVMESLLLAAEGVAKKVTRLSNARSKS